jgi:hypothetical protein
MNKIEMIEQYLDGKLSGTELLNFENRLKTDQEFANEVETTRDVNYFLQKKAKIDNFKELISEVSEDYFNDENIEEKKRNNFWYLKIAAIALILIGMGISFYLILKPVTLKELYAQYYKPYNTDVYTRSDNSDSSLLNLALQKYQQKEYSNALELFSKLQSVDSNKIVISFYNGISYLETDKYEKAISLLKLASSDSSNALYNQAQWYLTMAYLKSEKPKEVILILEKQIKEKSFYSEKASEILEELK